MSFPSFDDGGTLRAVGDRIVLTVAGHGAVVVQLSGTWVGTVTFQGSVDGRTYFSVNAVPVTGTTAVTTATTTGAWAIAVAGLSVVSVLCSAYSSGGIGVMLRSAPASPGGSSSGGGGGGGAVTVIDGVSSSIAATVFDYANSNPVAVINVDTNGDPTGGSAVSIADGADVAEGATTDVAVTGDNAGTVNAHLRGITKAAQPLDLDTGAGTATTGGAYFALPANGGPVAGGTATNPIRVDPTGTTAQPVTDNGGSLTVDGTVTTNETVPTTIYNGKKTVTTAGTRVTLASSQVIKSVTIKALAANTGIIYVGDGSVASTTGFQLAAGDSVSLDIANLATVNLDCSISGEGVTYLGVA